MLNRVQEINSQFDDPNYMENPYFELENRVNYQDAFESTRPPVYLPVDYGIDPVLTPIIRTAQYRFIDAATGKLISNVKITQGLNALGYSVNASGKGTFAISEANKAYTATAPGYVSKSFTPIPGKVVNVYMQKKPKTAQYKFVDASTGQVISNVNITLINDEMKNIMLRGLGAPTYANGIYTFPVSDFNQFYNISSSEYNPKNILISENTGVTTVKLTKKAATVLFLDALTKQPVTGVTVKAGLSGLLGLGTTYNNSNGLFTFSLKPNESIATYTISAPGYQSQKITVYPGTVIRTVNLKQIPKQPPVSTTDDDTAKRLRLAKAKAKARIRKIKLLAI